jgi:hypothetical protein
MKTFSLPLFFYLMVFFLGESLHAKTEKWSPDFLIIGAQKSGTSALYYYLQQHPLVVKKASETRFFDCNFSKGVGWYKAQYPERKSPKQLIGDKSPFYLFHPDVSQRVFSLYPKVKIIIILRNPVDRAYSHYWLTVRGGHETLSFEEALKAEYQRTKGLKEKVVHDLLDSAHTLRRYSYSQRGLYAEQIKPWLSLFPKEQILILSLNDLMANQKAVMEETFSFLGLEPIWSLQPYVNDHPYPPMNPETRKELVEYFRGPNQQLEELLGKKFNWDK